MTDRRVVSLLVAAVVFSGCSGIRHPGWLGGSPPSSPASQAAEGTFYSAAAGLPVHAEPAGGSAVVGRLSLHERVERSELAHGYAHVVSAGGVEGWVDNAKLLWRIPTATKAPAAPASVSEPPAPPEPEPTPAAAPAPPPAVAPAAAEVPAPAAAPDPPPAPAADPDPAPADPPPPRTLPRTYDPF
jgi:hypothetical protein